ncbi:hypothetical protein [Blastopirellula marina]|uniref:Uncharacterized protein n=1 Tax=Blastopirellula marina TaxID=124 RepID=A0A2S8G6H0_9BACT|nr:hypothetical protein [Blastopirellula marina]PQO40052.1 hypothetical protein C5Y98_06985 [Blastopirellula marina]PTL45427.1 hypothetical protein C5Y97_06985 [Blastopirellula marina]
MIEGHGGTSIQLWVVLPDRLHLEVEFAPNLIGPGSKLNPLKRQGDEALGQWSELETTLKR